MKKGKKKKGNFNIKEVFKKYRWPITIGIIVIIAIFVFSMVFLILKKDTENKNNKNEEIKEDIKDPNDIDYEKGTDDYFMENVEEPEETPESDTNNNTSTSTNTNRNDYYDYITTPLSSIKFSDLKKRNKDTVAFLKVNNTNVNYPVVQTSNNDYYLTHAYNKSYNSAGWVFMDYRNNINNLDANTIIYGHGSLKTTMFGTLKQVVKKSWYTNKDNLTITLVTQNSTLYWKIFSIYTTPYEVYYLTSNFGSDESHQKFINTMLSRSIYNFNESVSLSDKMLTLSTCYNNELRLVVQAKLIKRVANN